MHHLSCCISVIHQLRNRGRCIIFLSDSISTDFILLSSVGRVGREEGEWGEGKGGRCLWSLTGRDQALMVRHISALPTQKSWSLHEPKVVYSLIKSAIEFHVLRIFNWPGILPLTFLGLHECFTRVCLFKTTSCYRVMQELGVSTKMLRHVNCLWVGRLWTNFLISLSIFLLLPFL